MGILWEKNARAAYHKGNQLVKNRGRLFKS